MSSTRGSLGWKRIGFSFSFLLCMCAVSLKSWYEEHIRIFLTTWNQLRVSLATNGKYKHQLCTHHTSVNLTPSWADVLIWVFCRPGEIKIPAEFCQDDLDLNSDFKVLLPQRQGPGLCSTALVSYLIALHNDLVYCVDKHTGEETRWGRSCHIFLTCLAVRRQCVNDSSWGILLHICASDLLK